MLENFEKIFNENNFSCVLILIEQEKKIFFSIKDILHCCEYDITSKNIINQTISNLKKKSIVELNTLKNKYLQDNISYSMSFINEENNLYISDEDVFYFLISLKKGNTFKKCFFGEIFLELKKFYQN